MYSYAVGEITNVKISDINWKNGKIQIYGCKNRTYRSVGLDSIAIKYISDYILSRGLTLNSNEPLFTSLKKENESLDVNGIRNSIVSISKRSNINRRIYPHLFRKTTATNIVKRGGSVHDAGEYLGHKDRTTAGQHYTYIDDDHTMEIFNKYVAIK